MADAPRVVDIFAGCGGFGFGFAESGFRIAHAVEAFRPSLATYVANVPLEEHHLGDVRKMDYAAMGDVDVLIGGPPCEAFTVANADRRGNPLSRLYDDPVGSLTLQFIKVAKELQPRIFVMENVPPIMEGPLEAELRMIFARNGYPTIHFNRLQAEEYGTPSHRDRVFISNVPLAPPKLATRKTLQEAIGDLVSLEVDVPNHMPQRLGKKQQAAVDALEEGRSAYHYRAGDGRVHHTWTRLPLDKLAPTVKGLGRFVHPTEDRLLTPREHARLMGYPDDYVFHGSINETYNMVGESVPPPLSLALAREVKQRLEKG
ncbi:MAG TPA: DNA cytosine methyltransferase [Candidatus Thermoplasmatota archaeon]|nr:DNA cytosine methyltransferase [Candidatus Thermoplasmatota archaeon]